MQIQIPFQSNKGDFPVQGSPRLVNCYMEKGGNKEEYALTACFGSKSFASDMGGRCRGMLYLTDKKVIYTVQGFSLYKVTEAGATTRLATIPGQGEVYLARNDASDPDILVVAEGQTYHIKDDVIKLIVDYDFTPLGVAFVAGYFVFWTAEGRFYASELRSVSVPSLRFATAESDPDGLTGCIGIANTLYAIGSETTEVWAISGGADFPFSKVQGAHLNIGSNSAHSIIEYNNNVAFLGGDNVVYALSGYNAQPISTEAITKQIEDEADKSAIVCFIHQRGKNKFLTIRGSDFVVEYNSATGLWNDRVSGINDRWRAIHCVTAWNKQIFGDFLGGTLIEADGTLFTELGNVMNWEFVTSTQHATPDALSIDSLYLDVETGRGLSLSEDAQVMVSVSRDSGRTWFLQRQLSLGKIGGYAKRVNTYGLGQSDHNGYVFRFRITDPSIRSIIGIYIDAEPVEL